MALPRNVAQQNAETEAKIREAAEMFALRPLHLSWLSAVLLSRGLTLNSGVLVKLSEVPEQEGNLVSGIWLSQSEEFWEFEAVISRVSGELLGTERFENITSLVLVNQALKGKGKPFGRIAIEVLRGASA